MRVLASLARRGETGSAPPARSESRDGTARSSPGRTATPPPPYSAAVEEDPLGLNEPSPLARWPARSLTLATSTPSLKSGVSRLAPRRYR